MPTTDDITQRSASCSCGQLRAEVSGEPVRVSICHCFACQRRTGSAFGAQARFLREFVVVSGESSEWVRTGDEGSQITFRFCPACGATLYYTIDDQPDRMAIPLGAFADPSFPTPAFSVYESRKHAWVGLPEAMAHHP